MRITRIDFEGEKAGNYATAVRKRDSQYIEVTIFTPKAPHGCEHNAQANDKEDVYLMARHLQHELDECRGTNSMIHEYCRQLLTLSDC